MSRAAVRALLLALAAGLLACSGPTSILVRITSPLPVPGRVDGLTIRIHGDTTGANVDRSYPITSFPQTLSLRPGPTESSHVTLTVTGTHGGAFVVQRVVGAMFVTGTEQVVVVDLPADCADVRCGDGVDCVAGRCVGGTDGGVRDAGPSDAGDAGARDTGVDTALPDAGPDTGPTDAGCASDLACDDGVACTHDTCVAGACANTPDDALCATGSTCSATLGCPPRVCANDSECQDGLFCNGMETCVATVCSAAATSACDDADNCTTDTCDETSDVCTHQTRDADMDGFGDSMCAAVGGVPNTDCVDSNRMISPSVPDVCDGIDNDCSGVCDQANTCCVGAIEPCHTACDAAGAMTGTHQCGFACSWLACSPPAETCNGRDDDCNGTCDDGAGLTCCAGTTSSCTTMCGSTGSQLCQSDCSFAGATCTPPAESCNGVDDNCDTRVDEGFTCAVGLTQACTTTCGSTGLQTCTPVCAWGACVPPAEVCNGVDDNCVNGVDEGCGACAACPGATTVTGTGGRYDAMTTGATQTGSCGGAGSEFSLTFTTTGVQDVFITTHGASVDTVLYVRSCSCTGTEVACNNDADTRNTSQLHLTNLPAGSYQVFVDTASAAAGTMVPVQIYITPPAAESERCGNPTFVAPGTTQLNGTTCGFANDYASSTTANCPYIGTGLGADRVYYFYLPTARPVTINTCNAATLYDTTLYVRNLCNDATLPTQVACDDDSCSGSPTCTAGLHSTFSGMLGPGLFYLYVDGYDPTMTTCPCGAYRITMSGI